VIIFDIYFETSDLNLRGDFYKLKSSSMFVGKIIGCFLARDQDECELKNGMFAG